MSENPTNPSDLKPWSGSHTAILGMLILLGCLALLSSTSVVDTARDVFNAWQIATGQGYPLEGPYLASVLHSGPMWFYVLSLPLFLSSSWALLTVWVGLLTGLKYLLAYACGIRLGDPRFGLIWASLLALPNWTGVNYLIFSHTSLVETTMMFGIYCLIRWQSGDQRWFVALCLAISVAFHAHPTTIALALSISPLIATHLWQRKLSWSILLAGVAAALLPWIPYLASQYGQSWPDFHQSTEYAASLSLWHNALGVLQIARGTFVDAPFIMLSGFMGLDGFLLWLCSALVFLAFTGGTGLAIHQAWKQGTWRVPGSLMMLLAVSLVLVAMIRPITQYYLILLLYPPWCGLAALGWSQLAPRWKGPFTQFACALAVVSLGGFAMMNFLHSREGHAPIPQESLLNVRRFAPTDFTDGVVFPAWARTGLGEFVCALTEPVTFHGIASLVLEQSYALETLMRCPDKTIHIGGSGPGRHFVGINHRDAAALGMLATQKTAPLYLIEPHRIFGPTQPLELPDGSAYPPRQPMYGEYQQRTLRFPADGDSILLITNLFQFWMPADFSVMLDGVEASPAYQTTLQEYHACRDCQTDGGRQWSVTINAPHPEYVEVVTFKPALPVFSPSDSVISAQDSGQD